ncbi:hypothetical protein QIS74_07527 [Colletotrichum tabaci]|uniref:Uncharacterized protein n=1 Tax=Colletotrichum tabaci TaxID=1209068 RepID=A0AAV9TCL0_9PEZI
MSRDFALDEALKADCETVAAFDLQLDMRKATAGIVSEAF